MRSTSTARWRRSEARPGRWASTSPEQETELRMARHGKKYIDAIRRFDRQQLHAPVEAVDVVKSVAKHNFDETVEAAFRLGVDPRKADQMIRGTVSLPNGTGKTVRVAVFATGDAARAAQEAGADVVGADDLVARIQNENFLDFDVAIATPDLMGQVGRLGRVLGPRGLMPNPKTGTVTPDVGRAVQEFKAGKVEYRTDRYGNVHVPWGKASFDTKSLVENYQAVLDELLRAKPAAAKGRDLRSVSVASTMGPGVRVDPTRSRDLLEPAVYYSASPANRTAPQTSGLDLRGNRAPPGRTRRLLTTGCLACCDAPSSREEPMARPEKVAVVEEVRTKLAAADAAVLTEYRGLTVKELATLRAALRPTATEYKVFKNTLARRAVEETGLTDLASLLEGPVDIAFVSGDAVAAAKALRDFGRTAPALVVKGGLLGDRVLSAGDIAAFAQVAT